MVRQSRFPAVLHPADLHPAHLHPADLRTCPLPGRGGGAGNGVHRVPTARSARDYPVRMTKPDGLLVDIAAMVESGGSNQMPLTVVVPGAVITGRLAPESVWRQRVAEVLEASEHLKPFASLFATDAAGPNSRTAPGTGPTYLHLHVARILQGSFGLPHTGGMYRIAIADISSWTVGDLSYSDQ